MTAFAGNSLLCRAALKHTSIDAASFTSIRLLSGALTLGLIARLRYSVPAGSGSWASAFALFIYASCFSFAYVSLSTATGALLLFAAVQTTMIGYGIWSGERLLRLQLLGFMMAFGGLIALLFPGISAPPLYGSALMLCAGIAWGIYSLRGKSAGDPAQVTALNFLRATPITALFSILLTNRLTWDYSGGLYAIASGALTSGIGYTLWYAVLPVLNATSAAAVQLSVPVIAALGGIIFLSEPITLRIIWTSALILGGIALIIGQKPRANSNG